MSNCIGIFIAVIAIGLAVYSLRIDTEDVKSCMKKTGWSNARCTEELS